MPTQLCGKASDPGRTPYQPTQKAEQAQDQEDEEENLREGERSPDDAGEAKQCGKDSQDEKDEGPGKNVVSPYRNGRTVLTALIIKNSTWVGRSRWEAVHREDDGPGTGSSIWDLGGVRAVKGKAR